MMGRARRVATARRGGFYGSREGLEEDSCLEEMRSKLDLGNKGNVAERCDYW